MMSMRHATFERVTGSAIRTHSLTIYIECQEHTWMPAGWVHVWIWAM